MRNNQPCLLARVIKQFSAIAYWRIWVIYLITAATIPGARSQSQLVNVFLGTSGDHGQMSPAACSPFGMMSVAPQTDPHVHTGYEHLAKKVLGFTHTRFEGVGCLGSGGNILLTPFTGRVPDTLVKIAESASPGNYSISFSNGIQAKIASNGNVASETFRFPDDSNGIQIDLSHTLANAFREETHQIENHMITGTIKSGTTCSAGTYILHFAIAFDQPVNIQAQSDPHRLTAYFTGTSIKVRVAFSSKGIQEALARLKNNNFDREAAGGKQDWDQELGRIKVVGDIAETRLFYSLLYRVLQSPFLVSEPDSPKRYNGWSIWDNYKTQLPLLSLAYPNTYQDIVSSLQDLYKRGKKNWATDTEPSNSVRTEHAVVVLLDAWRKGYNVDFAAIKDALVQEGNELSFDKPDKALESCYDSWALAEIMRYLKEDSIQRRFSGLASGWKNYWMKDFKDLSKKDVDHLPVRGMYQGTIWQYRWLVPYDLKELQMLCGGEKNFIQELHAFFANDYYNATNETDIQAPYLFSGTSEPWRSQEIIHRFAHDTVTQYYFNGNSKGEDVFIGRVYQNRPQAYPRTMDDDGGAMSAWYILAAMGFSPACVGHPVWYLHVPLFQEITFYPSQKSFTISVKNFGERNIYIQSITLNGKPLERNWLTQQEIKSGGNLIITAGAAPNQHFGQANIWKTTL